MKELSPTTETNRVKSLINLMDCLLDDFQNDALISGMPDEDVELQLQVIMQ